MRPNLNVYRRSPRGRRTLSQVVALGLGTSETRRPRPESHAGGRAGFEDVDEGSEGVDLWGGDGQVGREGEDICNAE